MTADRASGARERPQEQRWEPGRHADGGPPHDLHDPIQNASHLTGLRWRATDLNRRVAALDDDVARLGEPRTVAAVAADLHGELGMVHLALGQREVANERLRTAAGLLLEAVDLTEPLREQNPCEAAIARARLGLYRASQQQWETAGLDLGTVGDLFAQASRDAPAREIADYYHERHANYRLRAAELAIDQGRAREARPLLASLANDPCLPRTLRPELRRAQFLAGVDELRRGRLPPDRQQAIAKQAAEQFERQGRHGEAGMTWLLAFDQQREHGRVAPAVRCLLAADACATASRDPSLRGLLHWVRPAWLAELKGEALSPAEDRAMRLEMLTGLYLLDQKAQNPQAARLAAALREPRPTTERLLLTDTWQQRRRAPSTAHLAIALQRPELPPRRYTTDAFRYG